MWERIFDSPIRPHFSVHVVCFANSSFHWESKAGYEENDVNGDSLWKF